MILLDTNYLIRSLVPGTDEAEQVMQWIRSGEDLCTSSVNWYEFLCGPVDDEAVMVVASYLNERILPYTRDQATEASRLFNNTGRKRTLRVDAMIAAASIITGADLATGNTADFEPFCSSGLRMYQANISK